MERSFLKYLGLITQLGLVVLSSTFVGLFVGLLIDKKLNTKPWLTIICLVFGVIGGFISAYQLIKQKEAK
jgi:ATP synthase protein I